jgi:hypothetical protein
VASGTAASPGIRVLAKNETGAAFTLSGRIVKAGESGVGLAQVSYRILRLPDGSREATIVVTESSPGSFEARTGDSKWVEVLDIQPL